MTQGLNIKISKKIFNDVYLPQLENYSSRFNVYYGGAGSGKSRFVVQKIILKALKFANRKILIVRKVGNTLRDSIFAEFKTVLADWGLYDRCEVRETLLTIELPNGSKFLFKGLDDPEKIKSISGLDDIVIEECTEIDMQDFNQLNLRLRSKNPHNQIHCMFNPVSKSNWVYKMWFEDSYNKKNTMVLKTTYKDNKFLPQEYIDSLNDMKEKDPVYYRIYALGEFATLDKLIYDNWQEVEFDWKELLKESTSLRALFGLDFGYINDPSAFIAVLVDEKNKEIYIFDEFYKKGLLNDAIAEEIIKMGYHKEVITADSAEQKSIEEIRRNGVPRIKGARKGKDSILNGIQLIRQYTIYVHPRCENTIEELKNYCWQKDKITKEYINKPIDAFNHALDALRYACENLLKRNKLKTLKASRLGL
ncbi:PBSX family phage terminase large subunit [Clostridium botulinum]|uniref:PBSX family phage terminase large subunit n=1 Tax=Clostridium botulinum TaxID=1491 RepID=UPI001E35072E|nr:PBSX family phage terminase large subunit [Clostridium botulinum]MCD3223796.1 PBSX family phage terminase large subunit [Clostridium botulinum C/D]MCD3295304.1 PBSX family phage terminase large subunit [Clostridium botulinum C/D]